MLLIAQNRKRGNLIGDILQREDASRCVRPIDSLVALDRGVSHSTQRRRIATLPGYQPWIQPEMLNYNY